MRNSVIIILLIIPIVLLGLGCSKNPSERIRGDWKVTRMPHDARFTITKDSVIFQFDGEVTRDYYQVKSEEKDQIVLEAFRPETGQKSNVFLHFSGDTLFIDGFPCLRQQ